MTGRQDEPGGRSALVVGASRGLGLALVEELARRGCHVVATQRSNAPPLAALTTRHPQFVEIETVDINEVDSVRALRRRLEGRSFHLILINAGIALATNATPANVDERDFHAMMLTNALAPVRALEILEDLVRHDGVIAVMSSELGSVTNNNGYWNLYSASKAALNMLMKGFAGRRPSDPRSMLLLAPGWIKTDMGGSEAPLTVDETIPLVVDTIDASIGVPGLRFIDRFGKIICW